MLDLFRKREPIKDIAAKNGKVAHSPKEQKRVKRPNQWKQFLLLSQRYIELLKNHSGNLLILLLQTPIVALLLLLLVKYEVGIGVFNPTSITKCPTTATILTNTGFPVIPSTANPAVSNDCQRVNVFLKNDPQGKAYAAKRRDAITALQDFIAAIKLGEIRFMVTTISIMACSSQPTHKQMLHNTCYSCGER